MELKIQSTTYKVGIDELKIMFAEKLNVDPDRVSIIFNTCERGDDRFGPLWHETVGIDVVVSGSPPLDFTTQR